jgi:hypothetical protein
MLAVTYYRIDRVRAWQAFVHRFNAFHS